MGLYNFKDQFAPRIRIWAENPEHPDAKAHTIRLPRKGGREDKPGDTMYLYTGLRTKAAARIIEPVICAKVESIVIAGIEVGRDVLRKTRTKTTYRIHREFQIFVGPFLDWVLDDKDQQPYVKAFPKNYGLIQLDSGECEQLARRDGFASFAEMMKFWDGRLPFYGHVFHWRKAA